MPKRSSTPKDPNLWAKTILDQLIEKYDPAAKEPERKKSPAAIVRGHLGGIKGGPARAKKLSPEERQRIARKAVKTRWRKRR